MANSRARLIAQMARARGLDPAAVLAIASVEGGFNGAIGDHGTSFGPFQLHVGGALPKGIANPQQWANSRAGIGYAEDRIAQIAGGLKGQQAVSAISSRFERPADVPGEIAKAMGRYGQFAGGALPSGPAALVQRAAGAVGGSPVVGPNTAALAMLAQSMATSGNEGGIGLLQLAAQRAQMAAAEQMHGGASSRAMQVAQGLPSHDGSYANILTGPGVNISKVDPKLLSAMNAVAQQHGVKITINSGYRTPQHSVAVGGFANDPHTRGIAVDAYVNGRPIGEVFGPKVWARYGVISGNQPNFYKGRPDPEHLQLG